MNDVDDAERASQPSPRYLPERETTGVINLDSEESYRYIQQDRVRVAATQAGAAMLQHPPRGVKEWVAAFLADLRLTWRTVGSRRGGEDRVSPAGAIRNEDRETLATADGRWVPLSADRFGRLKLAIEQVEDAPHTSGDLGVMALTVRSDSAAAKAGTDGDYQPQITDAAGRLWVRATPDRPSSGVGRTHVEADTEGSFTADRNLRTNTAGKVLHVLQMHFAGFNTNTAVNGIVFIRDGIGGTIKRTYLMSQAGLAAQIAASSAFSITETFPEPMQFSVGVYLDISTGNITAVCGVTGYEE